MQMLIEPQACAGNSLACVACLLFTSHRIVSAGFSVLVASMHSERVGAIGVLLDSIVQLLICWGYQN